ncbi:4-demethylwyosine synthase TYW1 [Methanothermobacter wolfeii]|uniref:S-adenosyl-L-methionine-dependent tRNA 4-demethylwyosine synthase n=1 Tax=Methanothermobacter wolfeii TaxID=145261 RepID=A0ABU8TTF6_METWO|nr:4-demethylwyosine synthase TYW1 [Methanothermobacter wolfeii]
MYSEEARQRMERMGYRFVGSNLHSAVKTCLWTKKSIINEGVCYKEKFYGIKSHRCLQMSPAVPFCQQKCLFCWRNLSSTRVQWEGPWDEPSEIIDGAVEAQRNLLCGYFGNEKADKRKVLEAQEPSNAAISLAGEPLLYPDMDGLLEEFHRRNFTTFLVTNGLAAENLESLSEEPTQLYISLDAPDRETYEELCRPQIQGAWELMNQSLELMPSFRCRRVLRITAVRNINMKRPELFADMIERARPDFVEIKAYMYIGYSRRRLEVDNMPLFYEVYEFAEKIAAESGMDIVDESRESRVVLLG